MEIPVRCFTCGKLIGQKWEDYSKRISKGEEPSKVLDDLGLEKYCCRRMLLSHINIIDEVKQYSF